MKLYCGVDLHSNNGVYAVTDATDRAVFQKRLPNDLDTVLAALKPYREDLEFVAVESTYNWYWLVDGLQDHGYPVKLANPAAIEQYDGLKDANDKTDALFLAHLGRLGILPQGYIYPKKQRSIRDLLRRRTLLVQQRTALILSVQNMFLRHTGRRLSWRKMSKLLPDGLETLLGGDEFLLFTARQQLRQIRSLCESISMLEDKALSAVDLSTEYQNLLTMPGVGMILALTIMLETGEISRFSRVGRYTSYCRCARATHTSNGKKKGDHNSKCGNPYLSWAYVEAVHHALRVCSPARKWYDRKKAKKNGALATKALASKWSKAGYYIMKNQNPFDLAKVFG